MKLKMHAAEHNLKRLVADAFRRNSWQVHRPRPGNAPQPDLIVDGGGKKFLVAINGGSEGRRDRLIPLLSQSILQAQTYVRESSEAAIPVAVVGARRVPISVARSITEFAGRFAPEVAVGVVDAEGSRLFAGHGLETLNASGLRSSRAGGQIAARRVPQLFSDLNQWMLKILLAQLIPVDLLSAPRQHFRNASELAKAANVSVMSAFRFVRQLTNEGFLDRHEGHLEVVRIPELLSRWAATPQPHQEFAVRWIIKKDPGALRVALKAYAVDSSPTAKHRGSRQAYQPPRVCLGLFAAADALGCGFVHGVPPYIYMEREDLDLLRRLGLSAEGAGHNPDAYIRIPTNAESVFRPAVFRDGVPIADVLQVWLDVSAHPSRGRAQANEIAHRVLGPLFRRK
jgi:hypothetical protein